MKISMLSSASALLLCAAFANAATEEAKEIGRELGLTPEEREAKKEARLARKAAKKAAAAEPEKDMYFELIYMEKDCTEYLDDHKGIGGYRKFQCDLYEKGITFGTYGANKIGETYWYCTVVAEEPYYNPPTDSPVWDCTVTDYIGGGIGGSYIRSEGITYGIANPTGSGSFWDAYKSHTGSFATVGGINEAKGIMGELDVVYDDYKMTWFHIYHVEAWNMGPQPDYHWY